jgi:flagellar motor protein MotB
LYAQWKATPTSVLYGDVGVFDKNSTGLTKTLQQQVEKLAATIRVKKFTKVALYGYTAQTGLPTLDAALSHDRALSVARYLRLDLRHLHVRGVDIRASGEGAISSSTSSLFSRVEVFVS